MPSCSGVPFFDEVQDTVPREQLRFHRPHTLIWEDPHRDQFLSILRNTEEFETPEVREEAIRRFEGEIDPDISAVLNLRAFGLVHRHFVGQLCKEVSAEIRRLAANSPDRQGLKTRVLSVVGGFLKRRVSTGKPD